MEMLNEMNEIFDMDLHASRKLVHLSRCATLNQFGNVLLFPFSWLMSSLTHKFTANEIQRVSPL